MPRYRDGGELSNEVKFWSNERLDLNEALLAEEYLEVIQHKLAAIRFEKRRRDPSCWMPEYCVFPGWLLWYPEDLSPRARLLCILLNTYRDLYDGVCPHIETLAKQLRVSKWTIVRCIQELRKAGMLRTRRRRGSLVFFLTDALRKAKAKGKIVRVGKNANSNNDTLTT
jgi:hypothetical protein